MNNPATLVDPSGFQWTLGGLSPELYQGHEAHIIQMSFDWSAQPITRTTQWLDIDGNVIGSQTEIVGWNVVPDPPSRMTEFADWIGSVRLDMDDFAEHGGLLSFIAGRVLQDFVVAPVEDGARAWGEGNLFGVGAAAIGAIFKPARAADKVGDAVGDVVDQVRRVDNVPGSVASLGTKLDNLTQQVARDFDSLPDSQAFTPRQLAAIQQHPNLRSAFRGYNIDQRVRALAARDPDLSRLEGAINRGVDFTDPLTGEIFDLTTFGQLESKFEKFGDAVQVITTN
jgi:hypothetical protein